MKKTVALIIRDGWGISPNGESQAKREGNAPLLASLPFNRELEARYPQSHLHASGLDVGLPLGQMGNSEVGHLNLGAGRIVYQDLTRINQAISKGELRTEALMQFLKKIREKKAAVHLIGLLSDGGVHSHQEHLYALLAAARDASIERIYIHFFTDGRDTSPTGAIEYVQALQKQIEELGAGRLATMVGRYFAMDRDHRWERTAQAYHLIFSGEGAFHFDPIDALNDYYVNGKTDEFIPPTALIDSPRPIVEEGDGLLFFNFRTDRCRQLCQAILEPEWPHFPRPYRPTVDLLTMTEYDPHFRIPVIFPPEKLTRLLGEVVSEAGKKQLRMAETEKYPHVTYFFNGGVEEPFAGEEREMVPSPKVATYDLKPEMSAPELTQAALRRLDSGQYDLLILNFANPDMVGHTGNLPAVIKALETVDGCVKQVIEKILSLGGCALVTSDHGNCERMQNDDGTPNTAHTTNLVQLFYVGGDADQIKLHDGILADIAPTLLDLLKIEKPPEMTGRSLLIKS